MAFHLPDQAIINIPIDPRLNLPTIHNVSTTSQEQKRVGRQIMGTANIVQSFDFQTFMPRQARAFNACFPCVADETNQQLTGPQKELLLNHWKFGINMQHCQELCRNEYICSMMGPNSSAHQLFLRSMPLPKAARYQCACRVN